MSAIVVVHGIGKQYLGSHTLHAGIAPAVADGVRLTGQLEVSLKDVGVAFYGHWFRSPGAAPGKGEEGGAARDLTDPLELQLLNAWWAQAAALEPHRVPAPASGASKAPVPQSAQRALAGLARSTFFARVSDRFLIGVLRQVRRYMTEPDLRRRVQEEVAAAIGPDTRVLIGHSLGSVIAYEALCAHPEWPVTTFVTIGSPLGIPNLVFDRLVPKPVRGRGQWPGAVQHWTNLCDRYDVVALTKSLAPRFPEGPRPLDDILIDNGWQAHAIEHHLTAVETGRAIANGLLGRP